MAAKKDIKKLVGQLFIVGFDGYSIPADFKKFIQEYGLGGTIYFKRNVQSPAQIAELSNELQLTAKAKDIPPLFISIDHEGGKVNRLVKPFTKFPSADHLGEMKSPKVGYEFGMVIAKELKSVGININYAPVVDVNSNPNSPVIKNRAFSNDPELCGKLGSAVARGIQKMGVLAVAKHFPGHGDTKEDSHFHLPKINKSEEALEALELIPFRRVIRSRVDGIMTAHILNEALDPEWPATMSQKTIEVLLREKLRYQRLVISDDLEMKSISEHYGIEQAAVLAVNATCDLLIYRGDMGLPVKSIEAIVQAVKDKKIPMKKIEQALERIQAAKKLYADSFKPIDVTQVGKFIGLPEHFKLADRITKKEVVESDQLESVDW